MGKYGLNGFIEQTSQKDRGEGLFELEHERILEVNLDGLVWTKMGTMVAYKGDIRFTREGILEHGIGKFLKRSVSGDDLLPENRSTRRVSFAV